MIKEIAKTGGCNFECWYCKLNKMCNEYNHKDNSGIKMDQNDIRKQFAENLIRSGHVDK